MTLDKAVPDGLTVTPSFSDGTATAGSDYTENTTAISFSGTAGETQSFSVSTSEDEDIEDDETFTVGLAVSGTSHSVTATSTATGTITNDDSATVTIADANADEGDAISFTVTLDKAVPGGLTVTPSFSDGTATSSDYTENTASISFSGTAGETQSFSVSTSEDEDIEDDETFTVGLAVSGTSHSVTATSTATGTINNDDSATVTIADASASEGDALSFTVTLDKAVPDGLTVTPSFSDGTASGGTDYTENTTALTFTGTANETQTFTISTSEDEDIEDDETFTVGLAVSGTTHSVTATSTATGTITNDDSATVTIADASADEGDAITFTVTLDKAVPDGLTVTPSFTDSTATEGTDYTENTTALTFTGTAGETQTFTVSTSEDEDIEDDETFTVGVSVSGTTHDVTASGSATGTITNDDSATVTIADANADEGDALSFAVSLDKAVPGGLTVTPSFTDGTATEGTDYTENTAALSFSGTAGETQTFTVSTSEDEDIEDDETFTVGLAVSGTSHSVTATSTATGTITNDDSATVTIADASADEGDALSFTVTLDKAVPDGLTVTPSFTDGTASEGTDYTENTAALTFTGTANETQTFTISTSEDEDIEDDETFTVSVSVSGTTHDVTASGSATGTITNDDSATITIADANADEGDAISFTVTLDKAVPGGLTVTPSFSDGTATEGTDYTENTTAISFSGTAGETQTFTVSTTEDEDIEDDETLTVGLSISGTAHDVTATSTATGTITNDASATITIADASADEGDALSFTVTLDKAVPDGLTVTPSFTDGTASEGTDYTENTTALTFTGTAGETQSFSVSTSEDEDIEDDETFTVGLSVSGTTHDVTASGSATGTITNDDSATVTIADASADEGDAISFTVTLDKAVPGGLTVTPSFTDGTATEGTDYTESTAALTFTGTANETQTFTVSTSEDEDIEDDETFTVSVSVSGTTHSVTATSTATGTITNDDSATVTIADANADEGDAVSFTVSLDKAVPGGLTVTPSFTDGTATEGTDYTENTAALTFTGTAGETQTFTVATSEDEDIEDDETFTVGLAVSGTTHSVTATSTATGTINNDDTISAAVTIADANADEGDAVSFTVTLDNAVPDGLTVTPSFTDGTATEGTDYTENTTALTFTGTAGETQTFSVSTSEDEDIEDDETFTVALTVSGTTHSVTASDTATGTINNDDRQPAVEEDIGLSYRIIGGTDKDGASTQIISIGGPIGGTDEDGASAESIAIGGPTGANLREGQALELYVSNRDSYRGKLVAVSFPGAGRNPASSADYTATPSGKVEIEAGKSKTWTLRAHTDDIVEHKEDVRIRVTYWSARSGSILGEITTGAVSILDATTANVTIADASASEGDAITFTLKLDKDVVGGFKVKPQYTNGTAIGDQGADKDFSRNGKEIAFAGTAGETKTFTVSTKEDDIVEHDETFTVGLRVTGTSLSVNTGTATGTINNDDYAKVAATHTAVVWIDEGDKETFTVKLDKTVQDGFKTTVRFTTNTNPGTAGFGTDYISYTSELTFAGTAGETKTFQVSTIEDEDVELHEPFAFWFESKTAPDGVTLETPHPCVIRNDDHAILTVSDANADEGESMTFTVKLDKAVPGGLTVTPTYTNGTTANSDYTKNLTALSFSGTAGETKTFTVSTTEDTEVEANETFTVGTAVSKTSLSVINTDTGTGTINDDESAAVTINDASADEGSAITFTVTVEQRQSPAASL